MAGTLAERCQMAAYLCYSILLAGFIYPVIAHSVWSNNGFLSSTNADPLWGSGAIDFAGSGVVHLTGGTVALFATMILGPRRGRFYDSQGEPLETPKEFPGHSMALQLLGTMILWFGCKLFCFFFYLYILFGYNTSSLVLYSFFLFLLIQSLVVCKFVTSLHTGFGFNSGSALLLTTNSIGEVAAQAAVSTALSGSAGGICALFTNLWIEERRTGEPNFSLVSAMNGSLAGLVAITGSCGVVEPWAAVLIGTIAGWLYLWGSNLLIRLRIDDAVDAIPVHQLNGAWGILATGFLASPRKLELAYGTSENPGWFYSLGRGEFNARLLANQTIVILFIFGWTLFTMLPFFVWLNYKGWLRADSLEELVGLDISYHGGIGGSGDGSVKKEYIDAYNKHKGTVRRRRQSRGGLPGRSGIEGYPGSSMTGADTSISGENEDPEMNQEAAAMEAYMES